MLLVADVHGEFEALAIAARQGEPLLVLGDLLNFVDYRTHEGLLAEVTSRDFVAELSRLRNAGDLSGAARVWADFHEGREDELRSAFAARIEASYAAAADALAGCDGYVTFGNADRPKALKESLPDGVRYLDGDVVDIEGISVGFVGGGAQGIGVPGEVSEDEMIDKLDRVAGVEMLCTHVAPSIPALSRDVIGGRLKQSQAVKVFIDRHRPRWHYFGDIHQPQATSWRIGSTTSRNVGYFRATKRPVRHG
jgi:Icc-related predicted phosphoesterase